MVADLPEVLLAEPGQGGAVYLGVAADVVMHAWVEGLPGVPVMPWLRILVTLTQEHSLGRPVLRFTGEEAAPLEQQDTGPGAAQCPRGRGPAHAGADDDDVRVQGPVDWSGHP